ncbi:MAG: hypothetical protein Q9209_001017 [Squamulea sp. 1 TL-2023]
MAQATQEALRPGETLLHKVRKALKNSGGASTDYQHVIIELQELENVLRQFEAIEPTEHNAGQINAIRGMALACQIPLRDFLTKIEQYEASMSPFSTRFTFKGAAHKTEWALSLTGDVTKLRALVAAKVLSINLLLAMHVSQTVSKIDLRLRTDNIHVIGKITEHHEQLNRVEKGLLDMDRRLGLESGATDKKLDQIEASVNQSRSAVFSLRSLSDQIIAFVGSFPQEVRDYIQRTLHDNWNIYQTLLQIQSSLSARLTAPPESRIKLEDALGRTMELPYELFRCWEVCKTEKN